jgi:transcriptional regulator
MSHNPNTHWDAGLTKLETDGIHGQTYTQTEIAEACGVTRSAVWLTEKRALKKLRRNLTGYDFSEILRELRN